MGRVIVIGAGGQLGNDLVPRLLERGDELVMVDRRDPEQTGAWETLLGCFAGVPGWRDRWRTLDATDSQVMNALIHEVRPHEVYHLAAMLSARCEDDPDTCWRVNMSSFRNVLHSLMEASEHDKIRPRLIWPSSIAAFGPPYDGAGPYLANNESPLLPRTLYGVTKVACEMLGSYYSEKKGVDFRAVRFPGLLNTAEPGGGSSDYANAMYFAAAEGRSEAVSFVGPEAKIPFMYMGDAVEALLRLAAADEARLTRRTYNICAFPSPSAAEIGASIAAEVPGFTVRYELDARAQNVASWPHDFDDQPARRDWGWGAEVNSLEKLTRRLLDDFRALRG